MAATAERAVEVSLSGDQRWLAWRTVDGLVRLAPLDGRAVVTVATGATAGPVFSPVAGVNVVAFARPATTATGERWVLRDAETSSERELEGAPLSALALANTTDLVANSRCHRGAWVGTDFVYSTTPPVGAAVTLYSLRGARHDGSRAGVIAHEVQSCAVIRNRLFMLRFVGAPLLFYAELP